MNDQFQTIKAKLGFIKKTWFIIIAMIVFPPVGIFLMWFYKDWPILVKIIVSIILIFYCSVYFGTFSV